MSSKSEPVALPKFCRKVPPERRRWGTDSAGLDWGELNLGDRWAAQTTWLGPPANNELLVEKSKEIHETLTY